MTSRPRRARAAVLASLASVALGIPLTAVPAHAIDCFSTQGSDPWYDGESASTRYDAKFGPGEVAVPQYVLDDYVPQGLGTWRNWDGNGNDLLVYTAYPESGSGRAVVQGINPVTDQRTHKAYVPYSHVGGITFAGGYAWISGSGVVNRYSLNQLRGAFDGTSAQSIDPTYTRDTYASSFLSDHGGYIYAGKFNVEARDKMYRYPILSDGTLGAAVGPIEVPRKAQGLAVTSGHYFFSTSYGQWNRSNIYVVKRGWSLDGTGASCFRAPTMSEGATVYNDRLHVIYESGAGKYTDGIDPTNVIRRLHRAPLGDLTSLVD